MRCLELVWLWLSDAKAYSELVDRHHQIRERMSMTDLKEKKSQAMKLCDNYVNNAREQLDMMKAEPLRGRGKNVKVQKLQQRVAFYTFMYNKIEEDLENINERELDKDVLAFLKDIDEGSSEELQDSWMMYQEQIDRGDVNMEALYDIKSMILKERDNHFLDDVEDEDDRLMLLS